MAWHLTAARRDAVVLEMLVKALHALEEASAGARRRQARLWIERAIEVSHALPERTASPLDQARLEVVEAVLERIAERLDMAARPRLRSGRARLPPHHNS